ncbi:MAG: hypothetical protein RBS08_04560 [Bdellovibrionales bacterium]|jgi:F-type H+-transporting ATPase subunit b|nr:hypothetical protein [Bdellovibrionales bacterium]
MAAEHTGLLADSNFWVLLAAAAFAVIAWKKGRKPIIDMLDARTERIRSELEEAERLRIEAQDLLSETQKKHRDALQTAQKIIDNAKKNAEALEADAHKRLEESLKRREEQLIDRIQRAEAAAVQELRDQAADIAARAAEIMLEDALDKRGVKLVDEAIEDLPARLRA